MNLKQQNCLPENFELGNYLIKKVLGKGGFGVTYLAKDLGLNTEVVIKENFPFGYAERQKDGRVRPKTGEEEVFKKLRSNFWQKLGCWQSFITLILSPSIDS